MTDARGWGRAVCDATDPVGQPCVLEAGHEGNHLTADEAPRPTSSYLVQGGAIILLVILVGALLPLPVDGVTRLVVVVAIVAATLLWIRR